MTDLRIEKMDEALATAYAALSKTAFDDPAQLDPKHVVWKHVATPNGPSTAYHLYDGERLVGRTLSQPRALRINGDRLNGAFMIDLYIHPDYRGGLNFMRLMEAVEAETLVYQRSVVLGLRGAGQGMVWGGVSKGVV